MHCCQMHEMILVCIIPLCRTIVIPHVQLCINEFTSTDFSAILHNANFSHYDSLRQCFHKDRYNCDSSWKFRDFGIIGNDIHYYSECDVHVYHWRRKRKYLKYSVGMPFLPTEFYKLASKPQYGKHIYMLYSKLYIYIYISYSYLTGYMKAYHLLQF